MIYRRLHSLRTRFIANNLLSRGLHVTKRDVKFRTSKGCLGSLAIDESTIRRANVELDDIELCFANYGLRFNATWLRDSCHCSQCTHQSSRQRLFTAKDFRREMFSVTDVNLSNSRNQAQCLKVRWADGHDSLYSVEWLRYVHNLYDEPQLLASNPLRRVKMKFPKDDFYAPFPDNKCESRYWTVTDIKAAMKPINYLELLDGFQHNEDTTYINANRISDMSTKRLEATRNLTDQLVKYGLAKIVDVPQERDKVLQVARALAYERPTGYGTVFDVVVEPTEEKNLAYSSLEFDLHSDLTYREMSPGVQLLHCIRNSIEGGLSFFSDAFNAANLLKQSDPALYEVLLQFPVTFIVRDPYRDIKFRRQQTVISENYNGDLSDVYYSPFMLPPVGYKDDVRLFYLAYDKFTQLLQAQENKLVEKMSPGDLFIFHNRRVLHGRSSYDAKISRRFLQGCYMDWDEIKCLHEKLYANKISLNE